MSSPDVYVVSEDLHLLLDRWSCARFGVVFDLPYAEIRAELAGILAFGEHEVLRLEADAMRAGMERLLEGESHPVVSVDPVYWPTKLMLQITRCVDPKTLYGVDGFHSRYGFSHPDGQITDIVACLHETFGGSAAEVVLVDDVVYSGKVVVEVIRRFAEHGIRVVRVVCGIAVAESAEKNPFAMCADLGAKLDAVFSFGVEGTPPALDEICERDFFVFCPMCGRSASSQERNLGFPYIEPFGLPREWASFGEHSASLSRRLIDLNARVLAMIEAQLGRDVAFVDLDRLPVRVRHPDVEGDSVRLHLLAHLG